MVAVHEHVRALDLMCMYLCIFACILCICACILCIRACVSGIPVVEVPRALCALLLMALDIIFCSISKIESTSEIKIKTIH